MLCPSCNRKMDKETVRYHTPSGYERKLVVFECPYDSCSGQDFTEDEIKIDALKNRLQEAEDVIKSGQEFVLKMWEVYDEPQYRMAFNLLQEHHGKYDGKTWSKEQGEFTARAAAWLKGGTE